MHKDVKIVSEERVFDSYFKVDKATVEEKQEDGSEVTYSRFKLTRPDAVTILVFNEDTNQVTLVKQFRYPVAHQYKGSNILEAVAGKIDIGETPKQAAVRELREEVGYVISEDKLSKPIEIFASPGYSTEKIYIFLAVVRNSDKVSDGGGVEGEHENIEIIEMDVKDFISKVHSNEIKDSKTIISANLIKI